MIPQAREVEVASEDAHKRLVWDTVARSYTDPRTLEILGAVLRDQDVEGRHAAPLAGAVQRWVQRTVRYCREAPERICAPWVTVAHGFGDCDDMAVLCASLLRAARVPCRLAFSGWKPAEWDGLIVPLGHVWSEAWIAADPKTPTQGEWVALETVREVPPGWRASEAARARGLRVRLDTLGDRPGKVTDNEHELEGFEDGVRVPRQPAPPLGAGRSRGALLPPCGPLRW